MTTPTRPLRADAARNRELLLAAATAEFTEQGIDASIADIARRAGVGKGTVFRHFATKEHLLAAIVSQQLESLATTAEGLLDADDPGAALLEFLTISSEQQWEPIQDFLQSAIRATLEDPQVSLVRERMFQAVYDLTDRARAHGHLRADVTGPDVVMLMCAPTHVAAPLRESAPDLWRRYLALIFDGLRPEGARPLPHPAPSNPMPT
jgi:AcrR family transcriptional regulator